MPIELNNRREVFWDQFLWDKHERVEIKMHRPEYRGTSFTCDALWEGNVCGYFTILKDGDLYRMYYRAADLQLTRKEDIGIGHETLDGHELWLKRERQFKVLAETAHREAREKSKITSSPPTSRRVE